MQRFLFRTLFCSIVAALFAGAIAHAQEVPVDEHPALSPEAQKLQGGKFIPLNKPTTGMKITRGSTSTPFLALPTAPNTDRMIPIERGEKFYTLPSRPDSPVVTRPRPSTTNADVTNTAIENIRKQQVLEAAGKLPTSAQGGNVNIPLPDTHGVKVTHGMESDNAQGIAAPSKTVQQVAPYGSKLQSSSAPKGASVISPELRSQAADRAAEAGNAADPLDVLLQGAPNKK